jgi:hypothetical protein
MWVFDFTVNTMTLLALSLAIGLLIDDAIVVRENIVRHLEMGKAHDLAAKEGTDEIGLAVMATTFAVVAVFIPVAFMGGIIGKIFFQFGVTVTFAVLVSLFVSFTLDPMLSSVWADPEIEHSANDGGEHQAAQRKKANSDPARSPSRSTTGSSARPIAIRAGSAGRFAPAHRARRRRIDHHRQLPDPPKLGFTWLPDVNGDEFTVSFRTPPGSRLEYTLDRGREIANFLLKQPETEFTYLSIGGGSGDHRTRAGSSSPLKHDRERELAVIQNDPARQAASDSGLSGPQIQGQRSIFGGFRPPIQISVQGPSRRDSRWSPTAPCRRSVASPVWPSPIRARRVTSRSSTCASIGRKPGVPARRRRRGVHAPSLCSAARASPLGGSAGLHARRGRRLPRLAAHLRGGRLGAARRLHLQRCERAPLRWCRSPRWPTCAPVSVPQQDRAASARAAR